MIQQTLEKIQERLEKAGTLNADTRRELQELLGTLKAEIDQLSATHTEHADSIAGFAQVSAHEATRDSRNPALLRHSIEGLSASVDGFEKSHPRLVQLVNRICEVLSGLGV